MKHSEAGLGSDDFEILECQLVASYALLVLTGTIGVYTCFCLVRKNILPGED